MQAYIAKAPAIAFLCLLLYTYTRNVNGIDAARTYKETALSDPVKLAILLEARPNSYSPRDLRLTARVVNYADDKVRNLSPNSYDANAFAELEMRAWNTPEHAAKGESLYGGEAEFHGASVDLPRAIVMVQALKIIERGLKKLEKQAGPYHSFADYVVRVASTLGIQTFLVWENEPNTGFYDSGLSREISHSAAHYWIDRRDREYIAKHRKTEEVA